MIGDKSAYSTFDVGSLGFTSSFVLMGFLRRKQAPEQRSLSKETVPPVFFPDVPGQAVTASTAMQIADAFACVRALRDSCQS